MADRVGKTFTLDDGRVMTVTEENDRRVYGFVDGEPGTHSVPAHSFDDVSKAKRSSSSGDNTDTSNKQNKATGRTRATKTRSGPTSDKGSRTSNTTTAKDS